MTDNPPIEWTIRGNDDLNEMWAQPSGDEIGNLSMIVSDVIASTEAASVVLMLAQPGTGDVTAQDRRWASMMSTELGTALSRWPVHLASAGKIQVLGPENRPGS